MGKSSIAWTRGDDGTQGHTWQPITGCSKVSAGCQHCYALRDAWRFGHHPNGKIQATYAGLAHRTPSGAVEWTGEVRLLPDRLTEPTHLKAPARIFVCPRADLFHSDVPDAYIAQVFDVMRECGQHTFQVLTKRARRMRDFVGEYVADNGDLAPNIWLGVSAENQAAADERIPELLETEAAVRWISCEPLLGPIDLTHWVFNRDRVIRNAMNGPMALNWDQADAVAHHPLDWVVVGCESGPKARPVTDDVEHPFDPYFALIKQCQEAGTPLFLKQARIDGRLVHNPKFYDRVWNEYPA
jgi:protein gp37